MVAEIHPENRAANRVLEKLGGECLGERHRCDDDLPGFDAQVLEEFVPGCWQAETLRQHKNRELTFRNFLGEQDYPLLLERHLSSRKADHDPEPVTLEVIANVLANLDGLTPEQGVIIASTNDTPIGYSRLGWYSSHPENRL